MQLAILAVSREEGFGGRGGFKGGENEGRNE
ncbi:hypothetical protein BTUL_0003g01180 [Botrytis tulipae]|uniref:Uncharacterized protein n=1 Tax=Botrytis tulipae TaxID=87230 RepID=A0A4Z1FAD8_9HELO|nr:hypothetical protein BTUL_0003g01180 [Botrytis tulipae]